jgi:hypothetical protein
MTMCAGCEKLRKRIERLREALQEAAHPETYWDLDVVPFHAGKALEEDDAYQRGEG